MNTESDFLRAIVAAPTDVTLRMVYADFLDESLPKSAPACERARVELIRLDAEADRLRAAGPEASGFTSGREFGEHVTALSRRKQTLIGLHSAALVRAQRADLDGRFPLYGDRFRDPSCWRYGFLWAMPAVPRAWVYRPVLHRAEAKALSEVVTFGPVCSVRLTVAQPDHNGRHFCWTDDARRTWAQAPAALFNYLKPEDTEPGTGSTRLALYATVAAAKTDLYRAVVRMFRDRAGLPAVDLSAMDRPISYGRA